MASDVEKLEAALKKAREAEEVVRIREGYFISYQFDKRGRCWEEWLVTEPCPNHEEPYSDEYNYGLNYCRTCRTSAGTIKVQRRVRAKQYDAPKPPEEYTP